MVYQKLLIGNKPYCLCCGNILEYREHRHPEAEFIYCFNGSFVLGVDRTKYKVKAGSLALISPMEAHEILSVDKQGAKALVIEVGPVLLKSHFESFLKATYKNPVIDLDDDKVEHIKLREMIIETSELYKCHDSFSELLVKGNLYKICAYLLDEATEGDEPTRDLRAVANVEKALELIHSHYSESITVERAAVLAGYSKSNFCKIFKNIVGDTFHNVLNRHRVENACCFLEETVIPVAEIAPLVGFSDSKSFCRVFKNVKGISPGQYRQKTRSLR